MVLGNWLAALQRDDVDRALEGIVSIAERGSAERVFVFDHVVSPHPPFIFDSDGSPRALPACFPISCSLRASSAREMAITREEYGKRLGAQIEYLNGRVLAAIDRVIAADPTAAVVVFSDHATRYDLVGDPSEANHNFFAARTPGRATFSAMNSRR